MLLARTVLILLEFIGINQWFSNCEALKVEDGRSEVKTLREVKETDACWCFKNNGKLVIV